MMSWLMAKPFKDNGGKPLTRAQAAAITGNIQAESGFGFNATEGHKMDGASNEAVDAWTKTGPRGLGVVQWTWNPGRAGNLIALARSLGKQWYEPEVQFQMILNEMDGGYGARLARAGFFSTDRGPGELAIIFHDIYEGSADTASMKQRRAQFAEDAYASTQEGVAMSYTYVRENNQRVEVHVAQAYNRMRAAFKAKFPGLDLVVTVGGGTRTNAEQWGFWRIYQAGGNLAAYPGTSNHEENGPRGPRALDLHDTGSGPGVTIAGNARSNWLRANAPLYGFNPAGYGFSRVEPWHVEYTGAVGGSLSGGSTGAGFSQVVKDRQNWMISQGYSMGKSGADGIAGNDYKAGLKKYQEFLKKNWGYTGKVDGIWGSGNSGSTQAAHQRFYDSKKKPAAPKPKPKPAAPKAPAFPLPKGSYFGPKSGPKQSVSGYFKASDRANLKKWQAQMAKRGWDIKADGLYGDGTAKVAKAFQKQIKAKQDGLIGSTTWTAAWTAPIT